MAGGTGDSLCFSTNVADRAVTQLVGRCCMVRLCNLLVIACVTAAAIILDNRRTGVTGRTLFSRTGNGQIVMH